MDEKRLRILKRQVQNYTAKCMLPPEDGYEEDVLLERDRDKDEGVVYLSKWRKRKNEA
jgi:hypothetical protein